MLSGILSIYDKWHYDECYHAECSYAKRCYVACHCAECDGALIEATSPSSCHHLRILSKNCLSNPGKCAGITIQNLRNKK
jgi:hypothetical protein